ncbi:uncharacterized protein LOC111044535 [Nilaparvata lugens]|uniref:uncharacterized protein LOC111044535 n=1 Tax=Nilaparvata lugens TaxID=108931 RepID=UPI00193D7539|nr:uncharacterized protein LOC111044535 [Nilaparvata lugens]
MLPSLAERAPTKRKVKPAQNLLSLEDLGESSDDSDFRIEDHCEESDDSLDSDGEEKEDPGAGGLPLSRPASPEPGTPTAGLSTANTSRATTQAPVPKTTVERLKSFAEQFHNKKMEYLKEEHELKMQAIEAEKNYWRLMKAIAQQSANTREGGESGGSSEAMADSDGSVGGGMHLLSVSLALAPSKFTSGKMNPIRSMSFSGCERFWFLPTDRKKSAEVSSNQVANNCQSANGAGALTAAEERSPPLTWCMGGTKNGAGALTAAEERSPPLTWCMGGTKDCNHDTELAALEVLGVRSSPNNRGSPWSQKDTVTNTVAADQHTVRSLHRSNVPLDTTTRLSQHCRHFVLRVARGGNDDDNDDDDDSDDDSEDGDDEDIDDNNATAVAGSSNVNILAKADERRQLANIANDAIKIMICCVCLGDRSDAANEIVECDGCGVTVHEGCYGVSDTDSFSSSVSSCSTMPWFCEACRAGVDNPECELCPNTGGIYKETDVGKWVHLVCALYVPGVAFGEVDKLASVTLFEMAYNKWGSKACQLCSDKRYARTGVAIGCDAGMCRTYFHVTCGQAAGLLAEAHTDEVEQADPFYAHCKLHSEKTLVRKRRRNWLALQLRTEKRKEEYAQEGHAHLPQQLRIQRKLDKYRGKYATMKITKPTPWVPTQKMGSWLTTWMRMPDVERKHKRDCIDRIAEKYHQEISLSDPESGSEQEVTQLGSFRKFSFEFVGYYLDRNSRVGTMRRQLADYLDENARLSDEQKVLQEQYDVMLKENTKEIALTESLKNTIKKYHSVILKVAPNKKLPNLDLLGKQVVQTNTAYENHHPLATPHGVPTPAALKAGVGFPLRTSGSGSLNMGRGIQKHGRSDVPLNNECGICRRNNDQHLLAKCDTCHLYYHLGCLHPPLTRMPKKNKIMGWIGLRNYATPHGVPTPAALKAGVGFPLRTSGSGSLNMGRGIQKHGRSDVPLNNECGICRRNNDQHLLAKCDTCHLYYHLGCLHPPLTRMPKKNKIMGWQCSECDKESSGSEVECVDTEAPRRLRHVKDNSSNGDGLLKGEGRGDGEKSSDELEIINLCSTQSSPVSKLDNAGGVAEMAGAAVSGVMGRKKRRREKHHRYSPSGEAGEGGMEAGSSRPHKRKRKRKSVDEAVASPPSELSTEQRQSLKICFKSIPHHTGEGSVYVATTPGTGSIRPPTYPSFTPVTSPPSVTSPPPVTSPPAAGYRTTQRQVAAATAAAKKKSDVATVCSTCSEPGNIANLVTCDECHKGFHFHCLDPPVKKSPKVRGYSWHCADCDPTESDSS